MKLLKKTQKYLRRCQKCSKMYRTIHKYSKVCPNCDTSRNKFIRNRQKELILNGNK
jgi:rRNA maturation endonuclease Nob1